MGEISGTNLNLSRSMEEIVVHIKEGDEIINEEYLNSSGSESTIKKEGSGFSVSVPFMQKVPASAAAQLLGSILASITLRLLFGTDESHFFGLAPTVSDIQAFGMEFIITFYFMFIISGVATDSRAIGELAGIAIGAVVIVDVNIAGNCSTRKPARSLGPAIVWNRYKSLWVCILAPILGMTCGAWAYNLIRFTNKPLREITRSGSCLKSVGSLRRISSAKTKEEFSL